MKGIFNDKYIRILRYLIVGGIGVVLDFVLFNLLVYLLYIEYLVANLISFLVCTVIIYYLHKNWTFKLNQGNDVYFFSKYLIAFLFTYIINNVILIICIEYLLIIPLIAKIIQIILSFLWSYTVCNNLVFEKKK